MVDHLKHIFILIGPKGSGKSLVASIVQKLYGIIFLRVESIAQYIKKNRNIFDELYHIELYSRIESQIRKQLNGNASLIFESTGLVPQYDKMIENLKRDFNIISIFIKSDPELCIARIKNRDASLHINISDKDVFYINQLVLEKKFNCDFMIENNGSKEELVEAIKNVFGLINVSQKNASAP